jgi:hypothetical protein
MHLVFPSCPFGVGFQVICTIRTIRSRTPSSASSSSSSSSSLPPFKQLHLPHTFRLSDKSLILRIDDPGAADCDCTNNPPAHTLFVPFADPLPWLAVKRARPEQSSFLTTPPFPHSRLFASLLLPSLSCPPATPSPGFCGCNKDLCHALPPR